jgi:transposase
MLRLKSMTRDVVKEWVRRFRKNGMAALTPERDSHVPRDARNIDAKALRGLAAKELDKAVATRLLALANIADGMGVIDAAARAKASDHTVREWLVRFQKGGIEALRYRSTGRKPMLNADQLDGLKEIVLARPEMTFAEIVTAVQLRFKVSYTAVGISRLLRDSFGLVRKRGAFRFAARPLLRAKTSGLQGRFRTLLKPTEAAPLPVR